MEIINHLSMTQEEVAPKMMLPCMVLSGLRADLASALKSKTLPFSRVYELTPEVIIEIASKKLDEEQLQLEVKTSSGSEKAVEPKLRRLIDLTHMFTWRYLSTAFNHLTIDPCPAMAHGGADEILFLYQCLHDFRNKSDMPYSRTIAGSRGDYEIFSVQQKGSHYVITVETNHIYGNSMKWRAEVEFTHQVIERAEKIVSDVLGEWLRPGGGSLRLELDRENVSRRRQVTT